MKKKIIMLNNETKVTIESNVTFGKGITIGKSCKKIVIGYGSFIGDDVYIDVPNLTIGEYTTIHKNTTIHGYKHCTIGNNCWIGQNCIIDTIGGTVIGNNVGIGAYSQLWTHIKFGDTLEGCKWNKVSPLVIEDDVWFVGHCIVSPILAKKKSMLLVGGVATTDLEENCIYGGSPAKNLTHKLGHQFDEIPIEEKRRNFESLYKEFLKLNNIDTHSYEINIFNTISDMKYNMIDTTIDNTVDNIKNGNTTFFITERIYIPNRSQIEYEFMKFLLYDKAKFNPMNM